MFGKDTDTHLETECGIPAATDPTPRRRLEQLFAAQAARTPDRIAIAHRGRTTNYGTLDARANRIARRLLEIGIGANSVVAICMERSAELIAVILGVLKAGAAYVPLDPAYPAERLRFMLEDSDAALLMSRPHFLDEVVYPGRIFDLDAEAASIERQSPLALETDLVPDQLAYLIYTSGSTGVPKGVMLSHSAVRLVAWGKRSFSAADIAAVAFATSICFDPSILEIFVPLCNGGAILIKENALDPYSADERPTMLNGPPSVVASLNEASAIPDSVRVINIGGEVLSRALVDTLYRGRPALRIYNHYGPTEATTLATVSHVARDDGGEPTVGHPVCDSRVYVLDEGGSPAPIGELGEIHIAGPNVALGYWRNPEQSSERFVGDPFHPGQFMYRTGDLGMWTEQGEIAFCGRADEQVKIRGFRVELGEIETALMRLPNVRQAAAVVRPDRHGERRIIAFVAGKSLDNASGLRRQLAAWLPVQSLPSIICELAELPLSPSGKIDRAALRVETGGNPAASREWLPPLEEAICLIFQRYLGFGDIDPEDDFFDLGGDSLRALSIAVDIEKTLGIPVPPVVFGQYATPRTLAAALGELSLDQSDYILPLNAECDGVPLLCMPDFHGRPLSFMSLADATDGEMPVVGLSPQPMKAAVIDDSDLTAITAAFRDAIRKRWPKGPYRVAGYSLGAPFALDLARALEQDDETVHLILIDGPNEFRRPNMRFAARWATREAAKLLWQRGPVEAVRTIYHSRHLIGHWLFPSRPVSSEEMPGFVSDADRPLARAMVQSVLDFRPEPFHGPALLIRCQQPTARSSFMDDDGAMGWRHVLKGPLVQTTVAATHYQMMRQPYVGAVIDRILGRSIA